MNNLVNMFLNRVWYRTLKSELVKLNAADESVAQSHFQYSRKLIEEMEKSVQSFLSQQRKLKQTVSDKIDSLTIMAST